MQQNIESRIHAWFLRKSKSSNFGRIRASGVVASLCRDIADNPVAIRKALKVLQAEGKIEYSADARGEPISGYITVVRPEVIVSEHELRWHEVVANYGMREHEQQALSALATSMQGFSDKQMPAIIDGLFQLRSDQARISGQLLFNVSARYLLGSSKLLSTLSWRSLKAFGINVDTFIDRPPYLIVGGNGKNPLAVILVENPVAFENAMQSSAAKRCAFVCTMGFGLSYRGEDYGNQLAGAIETGNYILLRRNEGQWQDAKSMLAHSELHFWGDLDLAAAQIFDRITRRLPNAKLSAVYQPMINAANNPITRHPYVMAVAKDGQKPFASARADVAKLMSHCREWAVDQEIVDIEEIGSLAGSTLSCGHSA